MPGWSYLKKIKGYKIYKNDYYIPMGFMYDTYLTMFELLDIEDYYKADTFLKAMMLSGTDALKYSKITGYSKKDVETLRHDYKAKQKDKKFKSKADSFVYGKYNYFDDCEKLRKNSCYEFKYNNEGFTAKINNKGEDNLLFFSVPYDEGWNAYVNGKETEIVRANAGFMAVKVDGHKKSSIIFKYIPPGFHTGIIITAVCGIIFFMYIAVLFFLKRRRYKK